MFTHTPAFVHGFLYFVDLEVSRRLKIHGLVSHSDDRWDDTAVLNLHRNRDPES